MNTPPNTHPSQIADIQLMPPAHVIRHAAAAAADAHAAAGHRASAAAAVATVAAVAAVAAAAAVGRRRTRAAGTAGRIAAGRVRKAAVRLVTVRSLDGALLSRRRCGRIGPVVRLRRRSGDYVIVQIDVVVELVLRGGLVD